MKEKVRTKAALFSFFTVLILVFGCGALPSNDNSDAATPSNIYTTVYFKDAGGSGFTSATSTCYDMYQAVTAVSTGLGFTISVQTDNQSWKKMDATGYENPNKDYGKIESVTVGSSTYDTGAFKVFVYNATAESGAYAWREANPAIGWYHPYADYRATYGNGDFVYSTPGNLQSSTVPTTNYRFACAAVAIVTGSGATAPTSADIANPTLPQTIPHVFNNQYMYKFNLSSPICGDMNNFLEVVREWQPSGTNWEVLSKSDLASGITIVGWGSNAYEALNDAFWLAGVSEGQNRYYDHHTVLTPSYEYYTYYSWMDSILNNGTVTIHNADGTTTYKYWASYTVNGGTPGYCAYTLGYYSTITGAPNDAGEFNLTYEASTY